MFAAAASGAGIISTLFIARYLSENQPLSFKQILLVSCFIIMATQLPMIMREKLKNVAEAEAEKARPPRPDPSHGVRENDHFYPSPVDIFIVRAMLVEGLHIPLLIVDNVLEEAEYWARSSTRIDFNEEQQSPMRIGGQSRRENVLLVRAD